MNEFYFPILFLVYGLLVGSFLNVCILRIPSSVSIVFPASRCNSCHHPLYWYHNIPVLSFIFLGGKCGFCKTKLSIRYPIIELLSAFLAYLTFQHFGKVLPSFLWFSFFISPLLVMSVIDLDHYIIPDEISLPFIGVGFLVQQVLHHFKNPLDHFLFSAKGALLGFLFLFLISEIYERVRKREGLGFGDVKLAAMLGAFLGWKALLSLFFLASFLGSLIGILMMIFGRGRLSTMLPFGPFLSAAALIQLLIPTWQLLFFNLFLH